MVRPRAASLTLLVIVLSSGCAAEDAELARLTLGNDVPAAIELRERHRSTWEPELTEQLTALGSQDPAVVLTKFQNYGTQEPRAGALGGKPGLFLITHFLASADAFNDDWVWLCVAFLFDTKGGLDGAQVVVLPNRDKVQDPKIELTEDRLRIRQGDTRLVYRREEARLVLEGP